jgi:hypothetical protein
MAEPETPSKSPPNRLVLIAGVVLAIAAAVLLAVVLGGRGSAPASQAVEDGPPGALTVDVAEAPALEPTRELRCFVNGQFVGMATLVDCARRNGLATDALDVGLDATGALAAAPTAAFDPPPATPAVVVAPEPQPQPQSDAPAAPPPAAGPACLRFAGSEWRNLGDGLSQAACVRALFAGTCVRPGEALYGRYGDTTLRLVPRRVEQSPDNTRFRTLVEQDRNCQFPDLG